MGVGIGTGSESLLDWKLQGNEIMVEREVMGIGKERYIGGNSASLYKMMVYGNSGKGMGYSYAGGYGIGYIMVIVVQRLWKLWEGRGMEKAGCLCFPSFLSQEEMLGV